MGSPRGVGAVNGVGAPADPRRVGAIGCARAAVAERERQRLESRRSTRRERHEHEQTEVVAEEGVEGIVVDEVAEASANCKLGAEGRFRFA